MDASIEANQAEVEGPQKVTVFAHYLRLDHDFINDEIIPLRSHCSDRVPHPTHGALEDRTASNGDDRLAVVLCRPKQQAVRMGKQSLRQCPKKGIHGNVQEGRGSHRLKRLRRRTFPDTADAVQDDDLRSRFQLALHGTPPLPVLWLGTAHPDTAT
jgi:hypothetical protein